MNQLQSQQLPVRTIDKLSLKLNDPTRDLDVEDNSQQIRLMQMQELGLIPAYLVK
jgi:hypothetical protein